MKPFNTLPLWRKSSRKMRKNTAGHLYWPLAMATSTAYFLAGLVAVAIAFF